jgi:hypothetical protein
MKSRVEKLVVIEDCGDELLDAVLATVNYELSGDGAVLVNTENLNQSNDTEGLVEQIQEHIDNSPDSGTTTRPYEGLVLLRR